MSIPHNQYYTTMVDMEFAICVESTKFAGSGVVKVFWVVCFIGRSAKFSLQTMTINVHENMNASES